VTYLNQRPANDPILNALKEAGIKHWAERGVYLSPDTKLEVADDLRDTDTGSYGGFAGARGYVGQGRLVLDGRNAGIELRRARSKHQSTRSRRQAIERLGEIITHELGHVSGITEHSAAGLMSPQSGNNVPWTVRVKARELVPRSKVKLKRPRGTPVSSGNVDS
jgi:hypothetical protein